MEIRVSVVTIGNDGEFVSKRGIKLSLTEEVLQNMSPASLQGQSAEIGAVVARTVRSEIEQAQKQPEWLTTLDTVPEGGELPFISRGADVW